MTLDDAVCKAGRSGKINGGYVYEGVLSLAITCSRPTSWRAFSDGMEEYISSYDKLDFVVKTRADIRNVWRQLERTGRPASCPEDMPAMIEDADVLVVPICPVCKEVIQRAKNLKLIVSARGA